MDARRALPSVGALLDLEGVSRLVTTTPRALVVDAARSAVQRARLDPDAAPRDDDGWARAIADLVVTARQPSLRRVLNGTGVVLHTNLGRAPLASAAIQAVADIAAGYSNLEYDLAAGHRGSRYDHCTALLRELTGAEDALVVNNNAGALVLALNTLARGRECLVSRGELVEIGGSFRVPDIMAASGARLVEVGTTNRTHLEDYQRAIGPDTAAIARVHRSNFTMSGFVADADTASLAALGRERGLALVHDLGSGLFASLEAFGLRGEPTAREAVTAGASVVTMSGDKLAGGPQAGLLLGNRAAIGAIRENPLTRSYRVDKLTLAALEATLALHRDPARAHAEIPVLAQLTTSTDALQARAREIVAQVVARVDVVASEASVGGGAFPGTTLPSVALSLAGDAEAVERALRADDHPVVARIEGGAVLIDLRTILPAEDAQLVDVLRRVLG